MYVMQLVHLKNLDEKKEEFSKISTTANQDTLLGKKIDENDSDADIPNQTKNQLKSTNQIKTNPIKKFVNEKDNSNLEITSFRDLIDRANKEKEIELKYDLERNVKLINFSSGAIEISFNEKLNKNFIKNLTEKLFKWTGERWIISLSKNDDVKSIFEENLEAKNKQFNEFKKSKIARDIEDAFPDAKLIDVNDEV